METYEDELWQCPGCGPKFDYTKVENWKCPSCDDPIWIMADVNGNKYVLERKKAKKIEKDDVILLEGMDYGDEVKKVKRIGKKIRIYLADSPAITENPDTFLNTIIGNWHPEDK